MKANHIPRRERLQARVSKLSARQDANHIKSPSKGNPYWCCKVCGIHDPELSIQGRHFKGCTEQGLDRQIAYYKKLAEEAQT